MKQIIHSLVAKDGKYILMPPWKGGQNGWGNLAHPDVTFPGGDSQIKWPVNTKFVDFDRTFIYGYFLAKAGAAYTKANHGLHNSNVKEAVAIGAVAGAIGDKIIGVDGLDVATAAVANEFAGGYFMPRVNPYSDFRIVESTAYNGGRTADEMDLTLSNGLTCALAADTANNWLDKNPYTNLYSRWGAAADYESVMGVTLIDPTNTTYQWIQTWGPCHIPGDEALGGTGYYRTARFAGDGSVVAETASNSFYQYAGYCIGDTTPSLAATWFVFIQLTP